MPKARSGWPVFTPVSLRSIRNILTEAGCVQLGAKYNYVLCAPWEPDNTLDKLLELQKAFKKFRSGTFSLIPAKKAKNIFSLGRILEDFASGGIESDKVQGLLGDPVEIGKLLVKNDFDALCEEYWVLPKKLARAFGEGFYGPIVVILRA